jgi:quercetin dioxygenase-like cupin family protein
MLVRGEAVLRFDPGGDAPLKTCDFLLIPANARHRVESVSVGAVWLALHYSP